ncbi:hypothetical protein ACIQZO_34500 [Streptomyces sp. NPDC097617]|uniref:hypothetical protein n=1 Tax=Streptomyces sp. NPDC097617 TaxID=3366091 RepID=UPI0037F7637E
MDLRIEDRVYLVTGASSGIGEATVRLLSTEGATVVGVIAHLLPPLAGQVTGAEWSVDGGALRQV